MSSHSTRARLGTGLAFAAGTVCGVTLAGAMVLLVWAVSSARVTAQGVATEARITQAVVLDTAAFNVRRLTFPPGYRQPMHTVAANRDELVILIGPGRFEGRVDSDARVVTSPGELFDVPKAPSLHAFANLGTQPVDVLVVQRK